MISRCSKRSAMSPSAQGFTILELVICLGILAVLASILLVGVLSVRETARRVECQNNLRQSVVGLIQVAERVGRIPGLYSTNISAVDDDAVQGNPFLAIAQQLAIPMRVEDGEVSFGAGNAIDANAPSIFTCPSNGDMRLATRLNLGVKPILRLKERTNFLYRRNPEQLLSMAAVVDGLSNTTALAERPMQTNSNALQRAVAIATITAPATESAVKSNCSSAFAQGVLYVPAREGQRWWCEIYESTYTHSEQPNTLVPDCICNVIGERVVDTSVHLEVASRSYHARGVNCAFLDGSVRFIENEIDLKTWNGYGTHDARD
jgi:prepilin-type N-terminal cleavage/methylation domain-containing protein/prepilin-type processing-associated H-X9-DG protein